MTEIIFSGATEKQRHELAKTQTRELAYIVWLNDYRAEYHREPTIQECQEAYKEV